MPAMSNEMASECMRGIIHNYLRMNYWLGDIRVQTEQHRYRGIGARD